MAFVLFLLKVDLYMSTSIKGFTVKYCLEMSFLV